MKGNSQERGNSGVFLNGKFEIQVLDSYQNLTYPDGQASAMYGQFPPLVNASRPPGEWQAYDIIFTAPRFRAGGVVDTPAIVTVLHNGIVVHNATPFWGPTAHKKIDPYTPDNAKGPIALQDHGNPGALPQHLDQAARAGWRVAEEASHATVDSGAGRRAKSGWNVAMNRRRFLTSAGLPALAFGALAADAAARTAPADVVADRTVRLSGDGLGAHAGAIHGAARPPARTSNR